MADGHETIDRHRDEGISVTGATYQKPFRAFRVKLVSGESLETTALA